MHKLILPFLLLARLLHPSYTQMIEKTEQSVVRVQILDENGNKAGMSTGFVVAVHEIMTAAHCTDGASFLVDGWMATVARIDEVNDLAILHAQTPKPILPLRKKSGQRFERLSAIGYGNGLPELTVFEERVFLTNHRPIWDTSSAPGLLFQDFIWHGMSGGPIVDREGLVVSINQQSDNSSSYGVDVATIRSFLAGR